jgi:hypothetical protein
MASLSIDALSVTSFETTVYPAEPVTQGGNCVSPLCMTEDQACTTPWCPPPTPPVVPDPE